MEILFVVVGNEQRNVDVYCVHREIKFLIEPLRCVQAYHFRSVAEISQCICFQTFLDRDKSDSVLKIYLYKKKIIIKLPKNPHR